MKMTYLMTKTIFSIILIIFFFYDKILEIRGQKGKQKTLVNHLTPSGRRNIGKQKTLVTNFYLMEKNEIYNKILYTNSSYFWFSFSIINYYIIKISVLCFSNVLENSPGGKKKKNYGIAFTAFEASR